MLKSVPPRFVLILWPVVDRLLRVVQHIRPLKADDSGIIRFNLRRYKGPTRILNDGSGVKAGDTIIELHLNNNWFKRRRRLNLSASQSPREFLGCLVQDLHLLAQQIDSGMFGNITALHGSTILHVAARRLGFQVDELPSLSFAGRRGVGTQRKTLGAERSMALQGGASDQVRPKTSVNPLICRNQAC